MHNTQHIYSYFKHTIWPINQSVLTTGSVNAQLLSQAVLSTIDSTKCHWLFYINSCVCYLLKIAHSYRLCYTLNLCYLLKITYIYRLCYGNFGFVLSSEDNMQLQAEIYSIVLCYMTIKLAQPMQFLLVVLEIASLSPVSTNTLMKDKCTWNSLGHKICC